MFRRLLVTTLLALPCLAADFSARYEQIRKQATPEQLYAFLSAMPKGADLHNHGGLSVYASVWYDLATSPKTMARNRFYTLTEFHNCPDYPDAAPRYLNIQRSTWNKLSDCAKSQFQPLNDLTPKLKQEWLSSLFIDKPGEGRDEFFERIVVRVGDLSKDPYLLADALVENMKLFGAEGLRYIEAQSIPGGIDVHGNPVPPEEFERIMQDRLRQPDAIATGVTLRFQWVVIRYRPDAEKQLDNAYAWVSAHRDHWVGINMAGREDNDRGYALRFLPEYRKLRRTYSDIPLSIHAGEKDNPGHEVRDTLLLGATRIGHGVNLITDPETMLLMRNSHYLVEINLVSNKVLEYVPDTSTHPFPEYLRFGIPVCLNTDDRGSWDSNFTDEYYTAVIHFHLTWPELVEVTRNSLTYSFAEPDLKSRLLASYSAALQAFVNRFDTDKWQDELKNAKPQYSGYARRTWGFR